MNVSLTLYVHNAENFLNLNTLNLLAATYAVNNDLTSFKISFVNNILIKIRSKSALL